MALEHFLAKEWQKGHRLKRGGGAAIVSFDASDAEARWQVERTEDAAADRVFDQRWAFAVLGQALERLRAEYAEAGRDELFSALEGFLSTDSKGEPLAALGEKLGLAEGAVKVAVHRLRKRCGQALRGVIADTVAGVPGTSRRS